MTRHTQALSTLGILSVALTLCVGCETTEIPSAEGHFTPEPDVELAVDVDSIDFGSARADLGETVTRSVSISNLGTSDVLMDGVFQEGLYENYVVDACEGYEAPAEDETPAEVLASASCEISIAAGGSVSIDITFAPTVQVDPATCTDRSSSVTFSFASNGTRELSVSLSGIGDSDFDDDGALCSADNDCEDDDASKSPSGTEICDGIDNNCDEEVPADESDADRDGFLVCEGDCDDDNRDVNPDAEEVDADGVDNDCDGEVDEASD